MEFDQLRGFLETAREKSFTRAAEKLFRTQPAVSLQIKSLESELGQKLFERHGKRVSLTEAGRLLYGRAEQIFGIVDVIRDDMSGLGELRTGRLTIGTSDTNCAYVLPPVVEAFRLAYPGVEIQLTDRMSPEVARLVVEGTVDFGIATLPVHDTRLDTDPLFLRKEVVIAMSGHPLAERSRLTLNRVAEEPILALEEGSTSRSLTDRIFLEAGVHPRIAMELGSIEVIKKFVEIGLGIAVVPEVAVQAELAAGALSRLKVTGIPSRQVGIVRRTGGHLSPSAEVFLSFLKAEVAGQA
jgi:DNA-binding transcriptional LysR family regulator